MASTSLRLLDTISLAASQTQPRDQVADLGAYRQLAICMRLLKPGTGTGGGRVKLQHAAVNEEGAFFDKGMFRNKGGEWCESVDCDNWVAAWYSDGGCIDG